MLKSVVLILALCGDIDYSPRPTLIKVDHLVVQDFLNTEETFIQRKPVVWWRVIHLLKWDNYEGFVYVGWVLVRPDGYPQGNRYSFFEKFVGKWWEVQAESMTYEMSNQRFEELYPKSRRLIRLKEADP